MIVKRMHFNKPQLRSYIIGAPVEILVAGRAMGKTTRVLARKSAQNFFGTMPRGTGIILNSTYTQALTRTLKELIRGWQDLGYVDGHHFIVGKRPSEKWKKMWKMPPPFAPPQDYKYVISWWNGAVAQLISQERPQSSNGMSVDWIIADELKNINEKKLNTELLPANRGVIPAFAKNIYHHGQCYTTDMPIGTGGKWILDYYNKMDLEIVNRIWEAQAVRFKLSTLLKKETRSIFRDELKKQIVVLDQEIYDLRRGVKDINSEELPRRLVYYHEASTLENIHALGTEYILDLLRQNSTFEFDTQILNLKPTRLEDGFYPDFDEEVHGYFAENESYFDNLEYDPFNVELDCRKDRDLISSAPLHMAMDYNRRIHPISVGQVTHNEIRSIKGIHALYPEKLKQAVDKFCEYYRHHKRKFVYFWYDHTAVGDMYETRMCDDVIAILRKNDWIVQEMYIGQQPGHEERYRMWGDLLTDSGKYKYSYRINRECCDKLILSKTLAEAEQRKDGFGKSKKTEHDPNFPAEESTHYSDAEDTWVFGVLESGLFTGTEDKGGGGIIT